MTKITFLEKDIKIPTCFDALDIYTLAKSNNKISDKSLLIKYYLLAIDKATESKLIGNSFFEIGCIYAELEDYVNMGKYLSLAKQHGHKGYI